MQHYHRACGWHAWLNKQAATKLSSLIPGTTDRGQELLITDRLKDASLSLLYRDTDGNDKCIDLVKEAIMHVTYRSKSVTHCRLVAEGHVCVAPSPFTPRSVCSPPTMSTFC